MREEYREQAKKYKASGNRELVQQCLRLLELLEVELEHRTFETEEAISYLLQEVPPITLQKIYDVKRKNPQWAIYRHLGLSTLTKEILRQGFDWSEVRLDSEWHPLLEEAARRFVESQNW
jgi:hypothetical protein